MKGKNYKPVIKKFKTDNWGTLSIDIRKGKDGYYPGDEISLNGLPTVVLGVVVAYDHPYCSCAGCLACIQYQIDDSNGHYIVAYQRDKFNPAYSQSKVFKRNCNELLRRHEMAMI